MQDKVKQDRDGALPWNRSGVLDPWDSVEAAMALDVGGEHARRGGLPLAGRAPAGRRLLGRRVPRGRRVLAGRGEQPRRLPRRRGAGTPG